MTKASDRAGRRACCAAAVVATLLVAESYVRDRLCDGRAAQHGHLQRERRLRHQPANTHSRAAPRGGTRSRAAAWEARPPARCATHSRQRTSSRPWVVSGSCSYPLMIPKAPPDARGVPPATDRDLPYQSRRAANSYASAVEDVEAIAHVPASVRPYRCRAGTLGSRLHGASISQSGDRAATHIHRLRGAAGLPGRGVSLKPGGVERSHRAHRPRGRAHHRTAGWSGSGSPGSPGACHRLGDG